MSQSRSLASLLVTGALAALINVAAASAATESVVYSFCSQQNCTDGREPLAGLTEVRGLLYGTSYGGGTNNQGAVFELDPGTGAEKVVYSFCSQADCSDGAYPSAGLIKVHGKLYGTTVNGGANGDGTVFAVNLASGAETVIRTFQGAEDGFWPLAGLVDVGGNLYGTAGFGGPDGCGTVFSVNPKTRTDAVTYAFCSDSNYTDGSRPASSLINVHGTLYGTTEIGGAGEHCYYETQCGIVFALNPKTGTETVLHAFPWNSATDGMAPTAGLIDVGGTLYGTTGQGGAGAGGTVFAIDLKTGAESVVYSFCSQTNCTDGDGPVAGLIDVHGILYGTTKVGGAGNGGTVFSINPKIGAETVLYSFCSQANCADGSEPVAGLTNVHGTLYGTTSYGGANSDGTVFKIPLP